MSIVRCETCGQRIVEYKHKLNKTLCNGLWKLLQFGGSGKLKELGLTNNEFANFQKLRYFGLVAKDNFNNWYLTDRGDKFLMIKETAPSYVITRNKEVIEQGNQIWITKVKDYFQSREDWEDQARGGKRIE